MVRRTLVRLMYLVLAAPLPVVLALALPCIALFWFFEKKKL